MSIPAAQLEEHRAALTGHCYRMTGSAVDADDAVQETMVRAWRNLDRFNGRASLRTWLYRIATNVCLDMLAERSRRARPKESGPAGTVDDPLDALPRTHWLEPVPDARALPAGADPSELAMLRQSIRLAFVAALQHLPPKQRAALLHQDATLSMPPYTLWLRGHDAIRTWLLGRGAGCRGSRLVPTAACGAPAFGQYPPGGPEGGYQPWEVIVLELSGEGIA